MTEEIQNKIEVLEEWRDALLNDVSSFNNLIEEQLEKKRHHENILAKKMKPITNKIAKFTRQKDAVNMKIHRIEKEILEIKENSVE
jgi:hypothetical protein